MSDRHRRAAPGATKRRVAAAAIVAVLIPAAATLGGPSALAADDPVPASSAADLGTGTFNGQATADGIRATIALKDYLIVEDFIDGGGPTAQASLDSLGASSAFSSLPYPGSTGVAFPGLVATLSGKSVPGYPFIVNSQFPSTPSAEVKQPGYLMKAESSQTRSAARTEAGATTTAGEEFGSFSTAAVDAVDGTITALGEARTRLALGAFALNGSVSKASITRTPDGKVVKTSSFEASSIRLGDLQIGVTDEGLVAGPQGAPLDPAQAVSDAFTSSGVTVKFLPAVQTADSVLSSGLEISTERPVPNVGSATAVVSYIVGRTFAQAQSAGFGAGDAAAAPGPGVAGTDPAAATPGAGAPGVAPGSVGPAGALGPDALGGAGAVPGAGLPAAAADTPAGAAAAPAPATVDLISASGAPRPLTEISFYPLLAALVPILLIAALGARRFI